MECEHKMVEELDIQGYIVRKADDIFYQKTHEWVKDNGDGTWSMGVDDFVVKILDYGDPESFPDMKGYTESEIVKLEGLIEQKDYSVELYQNFARLIFPVYFPLQEENN